LYSKDISQKIYWAFLRYLQNYDHLDAGKFIAIMKQTCSFKYSQAYCPRPENSLPEESKCNKG